MNILEVISLLSGDAESDVLILDPVRPDGAEISEADPRPRLVVLGLRKGDTQVQIRGTEEQMRTLLYEPLALHYGLQDMEAKANVLPTPTEFVH